IAWKLSDVGKRRASVLGDRQRRIRPTRSGQWQAVAGPRVATDAEDQQGERDATKRLTPFHRSILPFFGRYPDIVSTAGGPRRVPARQFRPQATSGLSPRRALGALPSPRRF